LLKQKVGFPGGASVIVLEGAQAVQDRLVMT
jgi:hypothetical protein